MQHEIILSCDGIGTASNNVLVELGFVQRLVLADNDKQKDLRIRHGLFVVRRRGSVGGTNDGKRVKIGRGRKDGGGAETDTTRCFLVGLCVCANLGSMDLY